MPLVAFIEPSADDGGATNGVKVYSLKSHSVIKVWTFPDQAISVKASNRLIVVAYANNSLKVFSALTLSLLETIPDSFPVFSVGSRFLAYASTTRAPKQMKLLENGEIGAAMFSGVGNGVHSIENGNALQDKAIDGLKKATNKMVKEVLVGANYLGNVGYAAVSNYLAPGNAPDRANTSSTNVESVNIVKESSGAAEGTVAVREFPPELHYSSAPGSKESVSQTSSLISHWKPHNNKLSNLTFNASQTLLFTSSTSANTFYIFAIHARGQAISNATAADVLMNPQCLFKLERGYTPATIESACFSANGRWCAVSTGRGTTHLYPLPYSATGSALQNRSRARSISGASVGTEPGNYEIGVMNGWTDVKKGTLEAVNSAFRDLSSSGSTTGAGVGVYPAARIKQVIALSSGGDGGDAATGGESIATIRATLCVGFLFDRVPSRMPKNARKTTVISSSHGSPSFAGHLPGGSGVSEDFIRLFRQRVVSMHPLGFLTLHYVDVGIQDPNSSSGHHDGASSSPGSWVMSSSLSPRDGGNGQQHGLTRTNVKDVLQWDLKRCHDWAEYTPVIDVPRQKGSAWNNGNWASQIETSTFDTAIFGAPVWMDPLFKMHIFDSKGDTGSGDSMASEVSVLQPNLLDLPGFSQLKIKRNRQPGPSIVDSHVAPDISSAMVDVLRIQPSLLQIPVRRRNNDVSFDDADVVDGELDGDCFVDRESAPNMSSSVQMGYFNKLMYKQSNG
ncbi:hypothetical protein HDU83_002769 [Entophlyctis luteolus]|nr:hypothetical protein HDU83_002769 [Entophlyctis luteolus]